MTPGEGFHVSRITGGLKTTRGTTRESTELKQRDEMLNVPPIHRPGESGNEDIPQRLPVMVGLPPPPPNVRIYEGSDVVIQLPRDIPDHNRPLCVSVNDNKLQDERELCDNLDI